MKKEIKYSFVYVDECNMCGAKSDNFKILGKRLNKSQGKKPKNKIGISTTIVKCLNCNLIFSNPIPIPYSIQDHYGIIPETYWNKEYFKMDETLFKPEISVCKSLLKSSENLKALDIGAGIGKSMISLSQSGFEVYGIEPSEPFYRRAIDIMKINPEKLFLGSVEEANYKENYFDFITFAAVVEHLYNPAESISKALKWLKPNGIMHIEVPSSNWLVSKIINNYYRFSGTDYVGNLSPMHNPFHLYEFGIKSFIEHSKKNNYEIALTQYTVCETYMPKLLDYIIKPYMKMTNKGMQLTVWLRKKE